MSVVWGDEKEKAEDQRKKPGSFKANIFTKVYIYIKG
jgi:hypothetical protein